MTYNEERRDLFSVPKDYVLVHCISADCAMGAGIAREFTKRGVKSYIQTHVSPAELVVGNCVVTHATDWVAECNLITKAHYWEKPTYETLEAALNSLKQKGFTKLAMPLIGCGLDKLSWQNVSAMVKTIDADILVCRKD